MRDADLKWIGLGVVIPDMPWILQRLLRPWLADGYLLDLRLIAIVQGSLLFCVILCGAFASISREPGRVFRLLALNSFLHLLLDACQTKLGNGVHFLAPFSWELANFGLFWPESPLTVILTVGGLAWLLWSAWRSPGRPVPIGSPRGNWVVALGLVWLWAVLPMLLIWGPERADNHSVATLRAVEQRAGREVAFDRPTYLRGEEGDRLRIFTREELPVREGTQPQPGMISVRARFVDETTVDILEAHPHWPRLRDLSSLVGLGLVGLLWGRRLLRERARGAGKNPDA